MPSCTAIVDFSWPFGNLFLANKASSEAFWSAKRCVVPLLCGFLVTELKPVLIEMGSAWRKKKRTVSESFRKLQQLYSSKYSCSIDITAWYRYYYRFSNVISWSSESSGESEKKIISFAEVLLGEMRCGKGGVEALQLYVLAGLSQQSPDNDPSPSSK